MPINEQEFESVKNTLDTLMRDFLPKFVGKLNNVAARVQELEATVEALKAQPVAPAPSEKPKRKRRTKAELEAAKAEAEQTAVDTAVDAAIASAEDPVDELPSEQAAENLPDAVAGVAINGKAIASMMMLLNQHNGDVEATLVTAAKYGCPEEAGRYILNLSEEERARIIAAFPM